LEPAREPVPVGERRHGRRRSCRGIEGDDEPRGQVAGFEAERLLLRGHPPGHLEGPSRPVLPWLGTFRAEPCVAQRPAGGRRAARRARDPRGATRRRDGNVWVEVYGFRSASKLEEDETSPLQPLERDARGPWRR
jgi:hypothetical protein